MLDCRLFLQTLHENQIGFFTGVPDSLLKDFCACVSDMATPAKHVIAANEGGAVGLAVGHYLATGNPALVYLQNSGQGNAVNPLLSICDPEVYGIPMVLLVGWRGEPGVHDEPQHAKQGQVTKTLFDAMELPYEELSAEEGVAEKQIARLVALAADNCRPVALIVKKGIFGEYAKTIRIPSEPILSRENTIATIAGLLPPEAVVVATTGHISRELYSCRKSKGEGHDHDFLMVGGMGHASQVALGIALAQPDRPVFCFDGDGATLMHMGAMALAGQSRCKNLKHIVFNNGIHGSVGGQPTVALSIDLPDIARACGYAHVDSVSDEGALIPAINELCELGGPAFLEVRVASGARWDLERPDTSPGENKTALMEFLRES